MSRTRLSIADCSVRWLAITVAVVGLHAYWLLPTACKSVTLIDNLEPVDVEAVARAVCSPNVDNALQLSRLSTVAKLTDYFDNQVTGPEHSLFNCKEQHKEVLYTLQDVLDASPDNVCSETKLAIIEEFHNRFVSTQSEHTTGRQGNREAPPQLLRLFFMHYVLEVDAICKRNLINNLEWDLKEKFGVHPSEWLFELDNQTDERERSAFKAVFKGTLEKFTNLYEVRNYEDVVMVWDLIEGSLLGQKMDAQNEAIEDEFDPSTGEPVRLLVKIKSSKYLNKIKAQCHYQFKPIYKKLILPVIKLADLGYSNSGEQFKRELEELRSNVHVKRWYGVTQLCEAILPVKFYEDPKMSLYDAVVLSKQEAAERDMAAAGEWLVSNEAMKPVEYEPKTNTMKGIDKLESVATVEAQKLVKDIKSNMSVRDRIVGRAMSRLVRNLKKQLANSPVSRFFFPMRKEKLGSQGSSEKKSHLVHQVNSQFGKSLEDIDEQELLKMEGACANRRLFKSKVDAKGVARRRRYRRKGDVDTVMQARTEALSYTRTKSWSEIFSGWTEVMSALAPSRTKLIIVGSIIIGMLFVFTACVIIGAFVPVIG